MDVQRCARAVAGRWGWLVVGGALGLVLGLLLGASGTARYESTVSLYVGAEQITAAVDDDPAYAAQVQTVVLPSVARLATSTVVSRPVVRSLDLPLSAAELAGEVSVTNNLGDARLDLTVTDVDPARAVTAAGALAAELRQQAANLYPGTDGALINVSVLGTASAAKRAGKVWGHADTGLTGAAGVVLAAVFAGLAELRAPRVRGARELGALVGAPGLDLPLRGRSGAGRAEQLAVLRMTLPSWAPDRITLTGVPEAAGDALRDELGPDLVSSGPTAGEGVVLVANARTATHQPVRAAAAAARASGHPLLGVVVDGLVGPGDGLRARLRAGWRGHGTWHGAVAMAGRPSAVRAALPQAVALFALAALGFTHVLPMALSSGVLVGIALLPLWLPAVRRYRGVAVLAAVSGTALVSGTLLAWRSGADHALELHGAVHTAVLVLTIVAGTGLILWARSLLSVTAIGVAYGLGYLAAGLLEVPGSPDPWKFQLSVPITIIVLAVAARSARPVPTVVAFGVVGLLDLVNDARSAFAFCLLGAVLVLWQARPATGLRKSSRPWLAFPMLGGLGALGYVALTNLMTSGVLGSQVQQRTVAQIEQSGSLILGGRPEWAATWALMRADPLGFGLGVQPSSTDEIVARGGLALTHVPTVDSYLDHQLFDGGIQLHSMVADLWAAVGPLGVVLGLLIGALVVLGLGERLAHREAVGLVCWLVPQTLWSLAFGPLSSDLPAVLLALGLVLVARPAAQPAGPAVPAPPVHAGALR